MMDPYQNQRDRGNHLNPAGNSAVDPRDASSGTSGDNRTPENPPAGGADRQARYSDGFTIIPPNESRRNKIKTMAQKEEEDLQKWRETNRVASVHETPERLGGNVTLAEAREKQFTDLRCSKLQKKMRKEELDKKRRQEEMEELQRKKDEQREKAERLKERQHQEEQRRREQLSQDHLRMTDHFLQRFERTAPPVSSRVPHTSCRSGTVDDKQEKSTAQDHRRVNEAFLDKLESRGSASVNEPFQDTWEEDSEDSRHQRSDSPGQQGPPTPPDPGQSSYNWAEEFDPEPDSEWALMKLMSNFPDFNRAFLEDILDQCNGDYEQASTLLICTLTSM